MLAAWQCVKKGKTQKVKEVAKVVGEIWKEFYLNELEQFYIGNPEIASVEHGLQAERSSTELDLLAASYLCFWHLGRLGILIWGLTELMFAESKEARSKFVARLEQIYAILSGLVKNNPGATRPVLDIQHIELFLFWRTLWVVKNYQEIANWLGNLGEQLLFRRLGKSEPAFICGVNSWDQIFERASGDRKEKLFGDSSSNLIEMLLELCCTITDEERDELLRHYFLYIARGLDEEGKAIAKIPPLDLLCWVPSESWEARILREPVFDGVALTVDLKFSSGGKSLANQIEELVSGTRERFEFRLSGQIPESILGLACLKNQSPVPPEFWRSLIFKAKTTKGTAEPVGVPET